MDELEKVAGSPDLAGLAIKQISGPSDDPGIKVVNVRGEEFLEQYELTYKGPDRAYGGQPMQRFIPAYWKEYREGRGPCSFEGPGAEKVMEGEICVVGQSHTQAGGIKVERDPPEALQA